MRGLGVFTVLYAVENFGINLNLLTCPKEPTLVSENWVETVLFSKNCVSWGISTWTTWKYTSVRGHPSESPFLDRMMQGH